MGRPVAENLLKAGYEVTVWDLNANRSPSLGALGAHVAASAQDLAAASDVVMVSVPGPRELEEVALGPTGALAHLRTGASLINLSTVSPDVMRRIATVAERRGISVIDAPVTGAADGARSGTLVLMIGGDEEAVRACSPIFAVISSRTFHLGPIGAGSVAKLLTNMIWFIHVVALSDALGAGVKAGLDPAAFAEVIRAGAADSWVAAHDLPNVLRGDDDTSFTLALCCKDLGLISSLLDELGVQAPLVFPTRSRFEAARDAFGPQAGELAVARLAEQSMDVSMRAH
jgi:3-hydroxyisobutyrate dehydrogenase-like beta-hydroxyacid dehydrogenase